MDMSMGGLVRAAFSTIRDPRSGARAVMAIPLSRRQRWEILLLIVVLSAALAQLSVLLTGSPGMAAGPMAATPMTLGLIQLFLLVSMAIGIWFVGAKMGGSGSLDDAIMLVSWLQFIMICLQVLQILALFILPMVSLMIGLGGLILFFWLLVIFISEMHGFKSLTAVFMGVLISIIVFAVLLSISLGVLGIVIPPM